MPIDTSIYSLSKPVEVPDMADAMSKAMSLKQMALANQKGAREEAAAAQAQKISTVGNALESLASMKPEDRPAAYQQMRAGLVQGGVLKPEDAPEEYDPHFHAQALSQYRQSMEFLNRQKTQSETAKNYGEAAKYRAEAVKANPAASGPLTPTDDPAVLVSRLVPKEHQTKALDEVKTAEDVRALTPKILAAFEKGSSRNPIEAAQGQREFEGLINTTVKDTEGTARQAAFDSIHKTMTPSGLFASPGENDTKRRTVLEYLQSKSSAPTARAYGVDLGKYASTSPYQDKAQINDAGGGLPGVSSSYAGTQAPKTKVGVGAIVAVNGKHYRVAADGDTLVPVGGNK